MADPLNKVSEVTDEMQMARFCEQVFVKIKGIESAIADLNAAITGIQSSIQAIESRLTALEV